MALIAYKRLPVITTRDIESLLGIDSIFGHCKFCEEAANDSYVSLSLEDWYIEELEDEITNVREEFQGLGDFLQYEKEKERLKTDLALINILREIFPEDNQVLISISW